VIDLMRPDTATRLAHMPAEGFVCVGPTGAPYWESARATAEESMLQCFGRASDLRLDDVARDGWRCVPVSIWPPTPSPALRSGGDQ
jgi:hypothetical protein